MEYISQALFWVSNSFLIPNIVVLLYLFGRALLLVGSSYNRFIVKKKNDKRLNIAIKNSTYENIDEIKKLLPENDNSLYIKYLRDLLSRKSDIAYADYIISEFEIEAEKDIAFSKTLAKIGPVLGLIGTLISMSPALVGLASGDISKMAYNMEVVFATTVVGLIISMVGLITQQVKQRWYAQETNNLLYISQVQNKIIYDETQKSI